MDRSPDSEGLRAQLREIGGRSEAELSQARARAHAALFGDEGGLPRQRCVGRYRLLEPVGQGGLGSVWRAHDPQLDRVVAIKLVREDVLARDGRAREQLLAEAASMAALAHPNVVRVYDLGEADGELFVAMEFIEGQTLRAHVNGLAAREQGWRRVVELYLAAGEGLAAAHAAGLVHGDFKPDNVLVGHAGRVLVSDFAVNARALGPSALVGTPPYMAPEQFDGRSTDALSDQFAFCVALWEALVGARPFDGAGFEELRDQTRGGPPLVPADASAPASVFALIRRGLTSDPAQRHADMRALLDALGHRIGRRRRVTARLIGAALIAVGLGGAALALTARGGARPASICPLASASEALSFDRQTRAAIETRLAGSSLAPRVRAEVSADLDRFVRRWAEVRARACQFGGVAIELGRAEVEDWVPCMDAAATGFTTSIELLLAPELRPVLVAEPLAAELPDPRSCVETGAIEFRSERGLTTNIRQTLARARALQRGRRLHEALALLEPIRAAAEAEDEREVLAHVELQRGIVLNRLGQPSEALRALERAVVLAEVSGDLTVEVHAAAQVCTVLMRLDERSSVLAAAAERNAYLAERLGDPVEILGAQLSLGYAALRAGEGERALAIELAALATAERRLGTDSPLLTSAHDYIGAAHGELGHVAEARAHKRRALELVGLEYGPEHIDAVMLLQTSARIMTMVGERDTARADLERAVGIAERLLGPESPRSAAVRLQLAEYWLQEGERAKARSLLDGVSDPRIELRLAEAALDHGDLDEAWAHWQALIAQARSTARGINSGFEVRVRELEARLILADAPLSALGRARVGAIIAELELLADLAERPRVRPHADALALALTLADVPPGAPAHARPEVAAARERLLTTLATPGLPAEFRARAHLLLWRAASPARRDAAEAGAREALARAYGPAHPAHAHLGL